MVVTGLALCAVAALIHVYIFYLESIVWTGRRARAIFRTTEADARTTKALAFNQGFYNLFLAIAIALGIVLFAAGNQTVGATLVFTGAGCMVAASIALVLSSPGTARAAVIQGAMPLLGILALIVGLAG